VKIIQDPDATLDYRWDYRALTNGTGRTDWLEVGETIASYEVLPDAGLVVESDETVDTASAVVVWLSGGTAGADYDVTVRVTTTAGRVDDRTITLMIRER
jgi:molybdopterin biosynthesis enzyme MoaB